MWSGNICKYCEIEDNHNLTWLCCVTRFTLVCKEIGHSFTKLGTKPDATVQISHGKRWKEHLRLVDIFLPLAAANTLSEILFISGPGRTLILLWEALKQVLFLWTLSKRWWRGGSTGIQSFEVLLYRKPWMIIYWMNIIFSKIYIFVLFGFLRPA